MKESRCNEQTTKASVIIFSRTSTKNPAGFKIKHSVNDCNGGLIGWKNALITVFTVRIFNHNLPSVLVSNFPVLYFPPSEGLQLLSIVHFWFSIFRIPFSVNPV